VPSGLLRETELNTVEFLTDLLSSFLDFRSHDK
jgi:hypothetical protein